MIETQRNSAREPPQLKSVHISTHPNGKGNRQQQPRLIPKVRKTKGNVHALVRDSFNSKRSSSGSSGEEEERNLGRGSFESFGKGPTTHDTTKYSLEGGGVAPPSPVKDRNPRKSCIRDLMKQPKVKHDDRLINISPSIVSSEDKNFDKDFSPSVESAGSSSLPHFGRNTNQENRDVTLNRRLRFLDPNDRVSLESDKGSNKNTTANDSVSLVFDGKSWQKSTDCCKTSGGDERHEEDDQIQNLVSRVFKLSVRSEEEWETRLRQDRILENSHAPLSKETIRVLWTELFDEMALVIKQAHAMAAPGLPLASMVTIVNIEEVAEIAKRNIEKRKGQTTSVCRSRKRLLEKTSVMACDEILTLNDEDDIRELPYKILRGEKGDAPHSSSVEQVMAKATKPQAEKSTTLPIDNKAGNSKRAKRQCMSLLAELDKLPLSLEDDFGLQSERAEEAAAQERDIGVAVTEEPAAAVVTEETPGVAATEEAAPVVANVETEGAGKATPIIEEAAVTMSEEAANSGVEQKDSSSCHPNEKEKCSMIVDERELIAQVLNENRLGWERVVSAVCGTLRSMKVIDGRWRREGPEELFSSIKKYDDSINVATAASEALVESDRTAEKASILTMLDGDEDLIEMRGSNNDQKLISSITPPPPPDLTQSECLLRSLRVVYQHCVFEMNRLTNLTLKDTPEMYKDKMIETALTEKIMDIKIFLKGFFLSTSMALRQLAIKEASNDAEMFVVLSRQWSDAQADAIRQTHMSNVKKLLEGLDFEGFIRMMKDGNMDASPKLCHLNRGLSSRMMDELVEGLQRQIEINKEQMKQKLTPFCVPWTTSPEIVINSETTTEGGGPRAKPDTSVENVVLLGDAKEALSRASCETQAYQILIKHRKFQKLITQSIDRILESRKKRIIKSFDGFFWDKTKGALINSSVVNEPSLFSLVPRLAEFLDCSRLRTALYIHGEETVPVSGHNLPPENDGDTDDETCDYENETWNLSKTTKPVRKSLCAMELMKMHQDDDNQKRHSHLSLRPSWSNNHPKSVSHHQSPRLSGTPWSLGRTSVCSNWQQALACYSQSGFRSEESQNLIPSFGIERGVASGSSSSRVAKAGRTPWSHLSLPSSARETPMPAARVAALTQWEEA